ncbi:hypothetical protein A2631_00105 [Candidatus Daviesbacteria bacterium RIFCSPHIGHO2_01_FULL_44_29]|uniref:Uncharacterized protein n=1 Tax=Candidatus Daviesbacteria bacterium RIFCSPHIGHO2_02_FULL_43_12 TaxID=1797776 RepID=A0A1F5KI26_9BACT|nr:MAG: hypothetical protein A2631_00105 [Candidatus Daviesbacteria bacterium RIFCSPHIGHO2_01_FULL_44_29]OGE40562.1 MAG: hypothetical protein A3D25_00390 [Candidatus Daviesbacteria bacterium RIFCSPHIGHO2_02_FULL_43_12]OGE40920.1 MAG: hypothetical protein A3E86_05530 [Candidatus Daviesbacteria bacterium RIFCSPHIGHO2_12_FULL_47_45]OGE70122.1 MAG: hypothetical protein A3B55_00160 [Candidatus Daviesbacteria bacterium RIFCSPLOWO2_01_FULL_43_15]
MYGSRTTAIQDVWNDTGKLEGVVPHAGKTVRARGLLEAFMAHTNPDTWRMHTGTMTPDMHDADTVLYGAANTTEAAGVVASVRLSLGPLFLNSHHIQQRGGLAVVSAVNERSSVLAVQLVNFDDILQQGWRSQRGKDIFLRVFDRTRDDRSRGDTGFYQEGRFSLLTVSSSADRPAVATNNWLMSLFAATVTNST